MAHQLCTRKATHTALNRSARGHRFAAPCAIQPKRRDRPRLNHRRQTVDPRGFTRPKAAPRVPEDLAVAGICLFTGPASKSTSAPRASSRLKRPCGRQAQRQIKRAIKPSAPRAGREEKVPNKTRKLRNPKASCASPEEFRRLLYLQSQLPFRRQEKVQPDASPHVSDRMGSRTPRAPDLKRRGLPAVDSRSANSTSDEKRLARKDRRFRYPDGPSGRADQRAEHATPTTPRSPSEKDSQAPSALVCCCRHSVDLLKTSQ